jgi:AGCS family alanine or glycine:cation symporter
MRGGPGAVFWMWVSAFFGMVTKYCEIVLAVKYREVDEDGAHHGGPMYYIEKGLKLKWLAVLFAIFATLATFGIGNMTQANAVSGAVERTFPIPVWVTGIFIAVFTAVVIIGGIKRIGSVTEKLVPFMAAFYIVGSLILIIVNIGNLPGALGMIFGNAFSTEAVTGGIMGYVIMMAMRFGIARGIFSNEAGLGSAPIAHAASSNKDPVKQGLWGVFEVFVDTMIICTLTAFVILTSGLITSAGMVFDGTLAEQLGGGGILLTMEAFSITFGQVGRIFITIAIMCFAFSTILGWSYYGERSLGYLTNNNKSIELAYKIIFVILTFIGSAAAMFGDAKVALDLIWDIADTLNGLMAIPNLIALLLMAKVVAELTKKYINTGSSVD